MRTLSMGSDKHLKTSSCALFFKNIRGVSDRAYEKYRIISNNTIKPLRITKKIKKFKKIRTLDFRHINFVTGAICKIYFCLKKIIEFYKFFFGYLVPLDW